MMSRHVLCILSSFFLAFGLPLRPAPAATLAAGMNIVNPMRANEAARTALIDQLRATGVHLVRCGIYNDVAGIAFAKALYAAGIKIDLIVAPEYAPGAPIISYPPGKYPGMWGGHPLSAADTTLSQGEFQSLIVKLDAAGVVLAGLELGNEINWVAFNPEFPLPGEGKVFSLTDLSNDPEGRKIAAGYLQYLKIIAVLKQVRDASSLNRKVPIISAGLSPAGPPRTNPPGGIREDAVAINPTLQFLRAHGLDNYVDAYGIHTYPWQKTAAARAEAIAAQDVTECGTAGAKPCWITEWGFDNKELSCPVNDQARTALVRETMQIFRRLAAAGRVSAVIFFAWDSDPWSKQMSPGVAYRCGGLSEGGRAALTP
jgi:hypothetical protein